MKHKLTAGLLAAMMLLVQGVLGGMAGVAAGIPQKDNPNLRAVVYGNSEFAIEMYKKVGAAGEKGNIFFSPLSISTALSMTYAGARGETAKQMADTLRFKLTASDQHAAFGALAAALETGQQKLPLEISNALWGSRDMHSNRNPRIGEKGL